MKCCLSLCLVVLLSACGGGGGSGPAMDPADDTTVDTSSESSLNKPDTADTSADQGVTTILQWDQGVWNKSVWQ